MPNVLLVVGAVLIGGLLLEGGLRICLGQPGCRAFVDTDHPELLRDRKPALSGHPYLAYYPTPGHASDDGRNVHNGLGFRGAPDPQTPKPPGLYRIVALGGSTTYSTGVANWRDSYPALLQETLARQTGGKLEVINAGVPGCASWETLVNFQFRVLDLDPDLVIVYQGINDVHSRLVPPALYRSDNLARRGVWKGHLLDRAGAPIPGKLLTLVALKLEWIRAPDLEQLAGGPARVTYDVHGIPPGLHDANLSPDRVLEANPPRFFSRNLALLLEAARERRIAVLLVSFAMRNLKSEAQTARGHFYRGVIEHNAISRTLAASSGALFLDLAARMPDEARFWSVDGVHFTRPGNEVRADLVARLILDSGVLARGR